MKNRISDDQFATAPATRASQTRVSQAPISGAPVASPDLLNTAKELLDQQRQKIETYVQGNPTLGLGAALCIGVLLGWFSKRR